MPFNLARSSGGCDVPRFAQLDVSTQVKVGDPLKFSTTTGKLVVAGTSDKVIGVSCSEYLTTATEIKEINFIPSQNGINWYFTRLSLATALNARAALTNASATTAIFALAAGTANDLRGGYVYFPTTGERRVITDNTYGGGNVTITFIEPTTRAITVGDTVSVCACGPLDKAVQMSAATSGLVTVDASLAGKTGGNLTVIEIGRKLEYAIVSFNV